MFKGEVKLKMAWIHSRHPAANRLIQGGCLPQMPLNASSLKREKGSCPPIKCLFRDR